MGIPRFFKFISDNFARATFHTSFKEGWNTSVDNLYLDANGIIHNCSREIYFPSELQSRNGPGKPRLAPPSKTKAKPLSAAQKELLLLEKIGAYMDQLLKYVKPRKLFYIAIDGPAPLAKQAQQRQRRYKSAYSKTDEEMKIFDNSCITPGTLFMHRLSNYIKFYVRKQMMCDVAWQNINVIFSGSDVPGEGEHKIVSYIRAEPAAKSDTHCMYGLDADLFMLSLSTHCPKFYLLREDLFTTSWNTTFFYKVDIGVLRKELCEFWGCPNCDENNLINDFIFICFLVGNDFLHATPAFHDLCSSIEFLMNSRKCLQNYYITNGNTINLGILLIFLKFIAKNETQLISDTLHAKSHAPNITLQNSLINPLKRAWGINLAVYRKYYYQKAGIDADDPAQVQQCCKEYILGLDWVQYYYHNPVLNWDWYYPYHYTPLLTDIISYLNSKNTLHRVSRIQTTPLLPFQQLLCVIPPRSKALVPALFHSIYRTLPQYYPETFKIDLEGKRHEWEGIVLLPFIDSTVIKKEYTKLIKRNSKKYPRNNIGQNWIFCAEGKKPYIYKSKFGVLERCTVLVVAT